eukprot:scaffold494084_cov17-Prasinocladus_malaysianus.AAC.1
MAALSKFVLGSSDDWITTFCIVAFASRALLEHGTSLTVSEIAGLVEILGSIANCFVFAKQAERKNDRRPQSAALYDGFRGEEEAAI